MKHIAFIGDSFCASYQHRQWVERGQKNFQRGALGPAWPSEVAGKLALYPQYYGYSGKSWWYSRQKFFQNCTELLNNNNFSVIVICHTDVTRLPSTNDLVSNHIIGDSFEQRLLKKAQDLYHTHLFEIDFWRWAQQSWIQEIKRVFDRVPKVIQFSCFHFNLFNQDNFHGMCFNTPLLQIQQAQFANKSAIEDHSLYNHFTDANNIAMTNLVVDAINNYQPGCYDIDLSKFHLENPKF